MDGQRRGTGGKIVRVESRDIKIRNNEKLARGCCYCTVQRAVSKCVFEYCRHRWLHYMTDDPPSIKPLPRHKWMLPHVDNLSGTDKRYVPYSTTRPKIEPWKPPQAKP